MAHEATSLQVILAITDTLTAGNAFVVLAQILAWLTGTAGAYNPMDGTPGALMPLDGNIGARSIAQT